MKEICSLILISIVSINLYCQVQWTKHPDNPVMVPGTAGDWDEVIIAPGSVIYHQGTHHMWYWGGDIEKVNQRIGHATSVDGINGSKDVNNPVLEPGTDGTWDGTAVGDPTVIFNDTIFHMWYEGIPKLSLSEGMQIGHATSADGIHWTKDVNNPVLQVGTPGEWDDEWVSQPEVIYNGSEYHMWYGGDNKTIENFQIGHATSPDGTTWTKDAENPVLSRGASRDWDYPRVDFPKVIFDGNTYRMWYSGGGYVAWDIGCATSEDGSTWTKYANNPVLLNGTTGSWDATFAAFSPVFDSAGVKYKMWYLGGSSTNSSGIGYAESSIYVDIPDTAFLYALIDVGVDTNGDSLISYEEAEAVVSLDLGQYDWGGYPYYKPISNLTGIEAFVKLDTLLCFRNKLTSLDLSNNTALRYLDLSANDIAELDLSKNYRLEYLDCGPEFAMGSSDPANPLVNLDITNNLALKYLKCDDCKLTSLDVSNNTEITYLELAANQLSNLDVSNITSLKHLDCSENQLTSLNVSNNTALEWLTCQMNSITNLDVSNNPALKILHCSANQLASLDISNNTLLGTFKHDPVWSLDDLVISDMPSLYEVCVWESFPGVAEIDTTGSPNVYFTIECTIGVEELKCDNISIYPNPINNLLTIG